VNLIHGAFQHFQHPLWVVEGLADGLGSERIEVDLIHFSGPGFEQVENRLMNLHLIRSWLTRGIVFAPTGEVVVPGELFYRKPVMVMRGSFKPVTLVNVDMMHAGIRQFSQLAAVDEGEILSLAEITMNSLVIGDDVDGADFLARIDLLASQGYTVLISDYVRYFRLRAYLRRYTQQPIGIVLSVRDFDYLFDEKFYEGMEGGILEAFGKLFPDNTHVYVYPSRPRRGDALVTLDNVEVPARLRQLLAFLKDNEKLLAVEPDDESHLHIDVAEVLAGLRRGRGEWMEDVPAAVAEKIIGSRLLGFDSE